MRLIQIVALSAVVVLLSAGTHIAYDTARTFNENRCWGCLALDPKPGVFAGFWIQYPATYPRQGKVPHPAWVRSAAEMNDVVVLFFWYEGCSGCTVLWNNLKDEGLVEGHENDWKDGNPLLGMEDAILLTVDVIKQKDKAAALDEVYAPTSQPSQPTTVILFEKEGTMYWYAWEGSTRPIDRHQKPLTVTDILEETTS